MKSIPHKKTELVIFELGNSRTIKKGLVNVYIRVSGVVAKAINQVFHPAQTPLVVLSEGCFGESQSKFALGIIRFGQWPIAAVIDSTRNGQTVQQVTGLNCQAPIVSDLNAALALKPKALLLGTAPPGGGLPESWFPIIEAAIQAGLHVISGLHDFLTEQPHWVALAAQHRVTLWDVRDPNAYGHKAFQTINHQPARPDFAKVVTLVGTDCSVGKMHTALALHQAAKVKGFTSEFVATGQTGIMITGNGVPLDRVIGDFMAGAVSDCITSTLASLPHPTDHSSPSAWVWVEGQGSINHPAYSGVTLSLLHGSNPDAMVLCHKAGAEHLRNYPQLPTPSLVEWIHRYEQAASWARPQGLSKAKVLGIAVNTSELPLAQAETYLAEIHAQTGLAVSDPVRFGSEPILDGILRHFP